MLPRERNRLVRLLSLTTSPHDGEALAASRMANRLMEKTGASWGDLIGATESDEEPASHAEPAGSPFDPPPPDRPANFGADIFGDGPAFRPAPMPGTERFVGRARLWLRDMSRPARWALMPFLTLGFLVIRTAENPESAATATRYVIVAGALGFGALLLVAFVPHAQEALAILTPAFLADPLTPLW